MSDRDFAAMVFRHVLEGADVQEIREAKGALILVLATPARAGALGTPTLQIELLELREAASHLALRAGDTLTVGAEPLSFVRRSQGAEEAIALPEHVTLGTVRDAGGKAISIMKLASVARAAMAAASGAPAPSIEALHAVRDHAVGAAEPALIAAGFRGRAPFWVRDGARCTQAVALENSRFNAPLAASFTFNVFVQRGTTTKTPRNLRALVALLPEPVPASRPAPFVVLLAPLVGLDPAKVAADTVAYVREVLLPWCDAHLDA